MKNRFVKANDLVYWAECDLGSDGKHRFVVHCGYYLATYIATYPGRDDINYHIVSLGNITSCVVRHLEKHQIFHTKEEAQKRADELNEIQDKFGTKV